MMRTLGGDTGSVAQRLGSVAGPTALSSRLRRLNASGGAVVPSSVASGTRFDVGNGVFSNGMAGRANVAGGGIRAFGSSVSVGMSGSATAGMPGSASGSVSFGVSGSVSAGAQVMGQSELMGGGSGDEAARGQRPRLPATRIRDGRMQRLEAVLLLAREPLNSRKLAQFANLADGTEARTLVRKLNEAYDAAGRAFRVEEVASGYQLFTRPGFATWLRKLGHVPAEMRLSAPALETLAVIAYRQPVPRADIEAIRGVNCGEILRQLMERDLARISGRSDELGRPFLYGTTRRFLQVFGLVDLDELPRAEKLRGAIARSSAESGSLG
jgi:segregation and condensation protein B